MKKQSSNQQATKNMNTINDFTLDYCMKLIRLGIKKSGILNKNAFWEESDLLSAGYLALSSAIESYNEEKHAKFDSYVSTCISNALKDMNNKEGYLIRVPRTKDKEGNYLTGYQYCDWEEWLEMENDQAEETSIVEMMGWMNEVMDMSGVSNRDRMVVEAKYGVGDYKDAWSTEELAAHLKMTPQSVNRICRQTLEKFRTAAKDYAVGA